ncbi:hypothetical protein BpHYR1_032244 [Brachionus plicatilis]|uniref:Uncharacterized protein n=1 Tax=Brachionus plicatilis TaxID=10195 RepID=A0A3M7T9D7_BRAPC|nr:hypothetical protein BpHYR1_032244 [Brachionus plicatilis]
MKIVSKAPKTKIDPLFFNSKILPILNTNFLYLILNLTSTINCPTKNLSKNSNRFNVFQSGIINKGRIKSYGSYSRYIIKT